MPNDDICNGAYFMCVTGGNEIAVDYDTASFTSGGGFSNITMRPSWQQAAVQNYLTTQSKALPPAGWAWNQQGRAVPDVAAFGYNFLMCDSVVSEDPFGIGGTSVASPIVAGMVALLNQESIKLSGKPLGFVNPLLYQAFAAGPTKYFNDITQGDNKCSDNGCKKGCQGFVAAAGWDPVTGLGSFNWNNLNSYVKQIHEERQTKFGNKN
jgi:tripeptidyl-peptidase I